MINNIFYSKHFFALFNGKIKGTENIVIKLIRHFGICMIFEESKENQVKFRVSFCIELYLFVPMGNTSITEKFRRRYEPANQLLV